MKNETSQVAPPASLGKRIISVNELLADATFKIPAYQRPL